MTSRIDSGSSRSASGVEPATSQKTTVTVFLAPWGPGPSTGSGPAQDMQNRARAGLLWPQAGHTGIGAV
jgi:hypothetical protein